MPGCRLVRIASSISWPSIGTPFLPPPPPGCAGDIPHYTPTPVRVHTGLWAFYPAREPPCAPVRSRMPVFLTVPPEAAMHYPWWYVPFLTSPMLIAVISVVHVFVSHYAVGGGCSWRSRRSYAYRTQNRDYLAYLKRPRLVLHPADRRLRRDHRRGHLVDDRPGLAAGDRGADPHLRLRLGHGVRLLRDRDRRGLHLLLLLGPAAAEDAHHLSAGSTPSRPGSAWC